MTESNVPIRFSLAGIMAGLMMAENLGDVADEIDHLHDLVGLERPEGSFEDGWTARDRRRVGLREEPYSPSEEPHNNLNDCVGAGCDGLCGERVKHSGNLGCPVEGCDGQTCEENED